MSLETKIMTDLKLAMKAKDQPALRAIRAIKAAILLRKTDGSGSEVTEEEELKILQKLVKTRKESLDIYQKQNREDLAKVEEEEISILEKYLPAALSIEEVEALVSEAISETNATSMKDMGKVMSLASERSQGRADGKQLAQIVRKKLS